mgnify:CR=1 FL=1
MYDRFYQFSAEPFRLSPDHAFAYEHKGYSKARAYMAYAFMRAEGFVMVTGRPGTGKTTLVGALIDQLAGENVVTASLVCTQLQADDLLKLVAYEFGLGREGTSKGELLRQLATKLKSWHRDGRRALLVVDEAQDVSVSAMEELRLLTNIQERGRPLLQIFLLGQPELRDLILSPALEQVHQRIVAACALRPLQEDETEAYVRHRLEVVGWRGDPAISRAVYPLVHRFSEGIPRRINLICSRLFLHCAVEQRHKITVSDMREALGELQGEDLAAGPKLADREFSVADSFDEPGAPATAPGSEGGAEARGRSLQQEPDAEGIRRPPDTESSLSGGHGGQDLGPRPQLRVAAGGGSAAMPLVAAGDGAATPAQRAVVEELHPPRAVPAKVALRDREQETATSADLERRVEYRPASSPSSRRDTARESDLGWRGLLGTCLLLALSVAFVGWAAAGFRLGLGG